jgi:hypothetical protein
MTDFLQLVSTLREQMNATLSRSDVLKPLAWLIGILATMTVFALFAKSPAWILVMFTIFLGLAIILYGGAYIFCLLKDRDALRSERYSLHKMAIEQGFLGDNVTGTFEDSESGLQQIKSSDSTKRIERRQ